MKNDVDRTAQYVKHGSVIKRSKHKKEKERNARDFPEIEEMPLKTIQSEVIEVHGSSSEDGELSDSESKSSMSSNNVGFKSRVDILDLDQRSVNSGESEIISKQHKKSCKRRHRHREKHVSKKRKSRGKSSDSDSDRSEDRNKHLQKRNHVSKRNLKPTISHDDGVLLENVQVKREKDDNYALKRIAVSKSSREENEHKGKSSDRLKNNRDERHSRVQSEEKAPERYRRPNAVGDDIKRERSVSAEVEPTRRVYRDDSSSGNEDQRVKKEHNNSNERLKNLQVKKDRVSSNERRSPHRVKRERSLSGESRLNRNRNDRGDNQSRPSSSHNSRRRRSNERDNYDWGKSSTSQKKIKEEPKDKQKPDFKLSGKLAEETNVVNGILVKYSEPPEARMPKKRWRLYPFKGDEGLATIYIHRQSAYLVGRDRKIADFPVDHPSCSKQHAAFQYRLVTFERPNGTVGKAIRLYLIDLESANGTFLNNKKIVSKKYVELREKDVIKFGFSSREYVLLHEGSRDVDEDVD